MKSRIKEIHGYWAGYYDHPTKQLFTSCRSPKEARFRLRLWHSYVERGTDPWSYWNDCFPTEYTEKYKQQRLANLEKGND